LIPAFIWGGVVFSDIDYYPLEKKKRFGLKSLSPVRFYRSLTDGDNLLFEALFRPLEFREPIFSMPVEGRYGVGFYGWEKFNPLGFDSTLISYEPGTQDLITDINLTSRTGSYIEFEALQTNVSYLLFKKSYIDILTGLGFRYSSVFSLPTISLTDAITISGPPELPASWGIEKKFSPTVLEGNVVTSFIMQWKPKWLLHVKYSYGLNRTRFYRGGGIDNTPYGTGRSSAVSVGIKYIRESETAARYIWGLELRHIYHKVSSIRDPDNITPISAMQLPSLGLFFSFGAFYGGQTTIGDNGKKLFLKRDYIAAKSKLSEFINNYPDHTRIERARKLLLLCDRRIPHQLYSQGLQLKKRGNVDQALEKFVEASLTANEELKESLRQEIDKIAEVYLNRAENLFEDGEDDEALRTARKATAVSEHGREYQQLLQGRIYFRQGKDFASRGFYTIALRKFAEALTAAPSLEEDIRRVELEVAVGMVEDVNNISDESSLRLALFSLYQARKILDKPDESMDNVITQLEDQLTHLEKIRLKGKVENQMNKAREEIAKRQAPRVELGMLVSEVQAILGDPHEIVEQVNDQKNNYQMWIYNKPNNRKDLFYFEDYLLFKVEKE